MARLIGGENRFCHCLHDGKIRQARMFHAGAAMTRALCLTILAFLSLTFAGAQAVTNPAMTDPYAWLEDIHGAKPLAWVKEQNQKSLAILKADPRYQKNYSTHPGRAGRARPHPQRQPGSRLCL